MLPAAFDTLSAMKMPLITALDEKVPKVQAVELLAAAEVADAAAGNTIDCRA